MRNTMRWHMLAPVAFALLLAVVTVRAEIDARSTCVKSFEGWIASQREHFPADREVNSDKLLYFLHVPRTAGRTSHSCFMLPSTPPSRRCAKSYDGFKFNISVPDCGLFASHDDFSAMQFLPEESAVYTTIRNPVDRFLSAYEFAAELGSRDAAMDRPKSNKVAMGKVSTKNVWPWSYLQPYFQAEIRTRLTEVNKVKDKVNGQWMRTKDEQGQEYFWNGQLNKTAWLLSDEEQKYLSDEEYVPLDPYNNDLMPSLEEFATDPIAYELVHNGQVLQVLGLTNNSHDPMATELRTCLQLDTDAQSMALDYAKERLVSMLHVGVYEELQDSLSSLATVLGRDMDAFTWKSHGPSAFSYDDGAEEVEPEEKPPLDESLPSDVSELRKVLAQLQRKAATLQSKLKKPEPSDDEAAKAATQEQLDDLRTEIARHRKQLNIAAGTGPKVVSREDATGRARQLQPDEKFRTNTTLANNFPTCAKRAQDRNADKRRSSLSKLKKPDGRYVSFSRAARVQIPSAVIEYITNANWMDVELHELATSLAQNAIQRQRDEGTFRAFPPYKEPTSKKRHGKSELLSPSASTASFDSDSSSVSSASSHDEL